MNSRQSELIARYGTDRQLMGMFESEDFFDAAHGYRF